MIFSRLKKSITEYPLLVNLVVTQLIMFGVCLFALTLAIFYSVQNVERQQMARAKDVLNPYLIHVQDQWGAWHLSGMDEVLNKEIEIAKKNYHLKSISFIAWPQSGYELSPHSLIYPDESLNPAGLSLRVDLDDTWFSASGPLKYQVFIYCLISMLVIILVGTYSVRFVTRQIYAPLVHLLQSIRGNGLDLSEVSNNAKGEMKEFIDKYVSISSERAAFLIKEQEYIRIEEMNRIASQVSHDIRSPLAALDMVFSYLKSDSEEHRIVARNALNRIRDIANLLLAKKKMIGDIVPEVVTTSSSVLLSPLIEGIVTEKRVQYRNLMKVQIEFVCDLNSYGAFALLNPTEFKSIVSNLLDNAVQALVGESGNITISLEINLAGIVEIRVSDSGIGFSKHVLKNIGELGFSHGKADGNGLGLYNAVRLIKSWGGQICFESSKLGGAEVVLQLARAEAPKWFVKAINLHDISKVVIFDDDHSIHELWREKFERNPSFNKSIGFEHVNTANSLRRAYANNVMHNENAIYLMDFEILGEKETGLDLIMQLGIQESAILVTSHFEEAAINEACESMNIKLIPKSMTEFVPLEM